MVIGPLYAHYLEVSTLRGNVHSLCNFVSYSRRPLVGTKLTMFKPFRELLIILFQTPQ